MTEDQPAGDAATGAGAGEDALGALRSGWDDAYDIGRDDERGYWARRRDGLGGDLTADDPDVLGSAIRADYAVKRVPCGLPAGKAG
ncbi:MAG: hypothetical protein ACRDOE_07245 [Streptosporangiaceae bacterium]